MRVLETGRPAAEPIERFSSHGAWSQRLGSGAGDAHVYVVHFDAGGEIGPHEAGFDQLFVVVEGSGWGAGADGVHTPLARGQAALYRRGEMHSKGSESGMKAIMIQIREMQPG
ncbi:MAG: cupin domain-containing protein [Myxococcota bacterium]